MAQQKSSGKKQTKPKRQQQAPPKENTTNLETRPDIHGWGADLDPVNRPAVPMERTPPRFINPHWTEIEQQPIQIEVFHSPERPGVTPVFGTSAPPRGLSGILRRFSYKMTENDIRHWLILVAADRVDMLEGILEDLRKGHVPNIFAEMGLKAELKYNKVGFIKKVAVVAGALGVAGYFFMNRNRKSRATLVGRQYAES